MLESGVGDGLRLGEALGLAVGAPTPTFDVGRLRGFATNSTPTMSTAMTAAATAAIQKGPRASGASAIEDRTRSRSPGLGEPLTWSNVLFSSRRKSSLLTSEHLLDREVGPQPLRGAVDARLGGGLRHAQGRRHLVEREVEIEMQNQRQPLVWRQPHQRPVQIGGALALIRCLCGELRQLEDRKPARTARHAALVRHDREKPGPQRLGVAPKLAQLSPRFDGGFLD